MKKIYDESRRLQRPSKLLRFLLLFCRTRCITAFDEDFMYKTHVKRLFNGVYVLGHWRYIRADAGFYEKDPLQPRPPGIEKRLTFIKGEKK